MMQVDRRSVLGAMVAGGAGLGALPLGARGLPAMRAADLRVEWRARPVGIDIPRPRFSWRPEGERQARGLINARCHIVLCSDPQAVARGHGALWDSGPRDAGLFRIAPERDLPLASHRLYWWSIRLADHQGRWSEWSAPEPFATGVLEGAWPGRWIAAEPDRILPPHAAGQASAASMPARPLPLLRGRCALAQAPVRAFVSVCGLGQYRLAINGRAVGDAALAPGWTNYRRRVLYDTYDVADLLLAGENVLALELGNGMYNVEHAEGRYTKFLDSFGQPKAILWLSVEYGDGRREQFGSDGTWRWISGPTVFSSIYGGEDVDGRLRPKGWERVGFDDRDWGRVLEVEGPGGVLRAATVPPVRVVATRAAVSVRALAEDVLLVDFGSNAAGRPAIELVASRGVQVTLLPGEALGQDGRVSQASFNGAPGRATLFRYTAAGEGTERFEPQFTYHGMRYVEVRGLRADQMKDIRFHATRADVPQAGRFSARPALIEDIHGLIQRAADSNLASVMTDCPHREKLGWLEQSWLNAPTLFYNRDVITLYEKLVDDMAEAQQADGMVPAIAPEYVAFVDGKGSDLIWRNSPEWGVACVLAPWEAYRFTGDGAILARAWPVAERYCAYLETRARGGLLDFGMGDWYDVGPAPPGEAQLTSRRLAGTACWVEALQAMARMAPLVGREDQARHWLARARQVSDAFNAHFLDPASGRYEKGSQTAQAMPLALGIVPEALREKAGACLIAAVRAQGNAVTAGDIGFRYVVRALVAVGRDDVLYDMLTVKGRPGYAWQLAQGATTLTEAWDANPTKSLNHFMLGHAEGWLYGRLAGLDVDHGRGAAQALRVAPRWIAGVERVGAACQVPGGELACAWRRDGARVDMDVSVPPGRVARIVVPAPIGQIELDGRPLRHSAQMSLLASGPEGVTVRAGSGHWRFSVRPGALDSRTSN